MQALDEDSSVGAMSGGNLRLSTKNEKGAKSRRSTRLAILDQASSIIERTTTVLGKRGHETSEAGMKESQKAKGDNKPINLRPTEFEISSFEGPFRKRARFSEAEISKNQSVTAGEGELKMIKRPTKPWVAQGLYAGQHRSDDARLTETRNKERKTLNNRQQAAEREALPMPMWIGDKIIEMGRDFKLPFDVFSPLPPGQPKPDEWKKTQKSTPSYYVSLNSANVQPQMCSLVTLPMCGRRPKIWSILHASAPPRVAATTIASTVLCYMNVTTATAK